MSKQRFDISELLSLSRLYSKNYMGNWNRSKTLIESFGKTLIQFREILAGGKKERAQDGFSASRARLRVSDMNF